jgi:broad specificity phosphatase PhoE/ribonuclease HI
VTRRLVVQADGGSRGNPGPAAYGTVVSDAESGAVLVEIAEAIGVATNNVAEYRGLLAGLRWVHTHHPEARVEARLDSKLVVEQMSGRWKIKHPDMKPLALAVRDAHPPSQVEYRWVPRAQNAHADRLLNEVLDGARDGGESVPGGASGTGTRAADEVAQAADEEDAPTVRLTGPPDLSEATTLLLIRHGETALTQQRRFSGSGGEDPPLAEDGHSQAKAAAAILVQRSGDRMPVDVVISSPLLRAQQTAQHVADAVGLEVVTEEQWTECGFGQWDGRTYKEIVAEDPQYFWRWMSDTSLAPPDGESVDQVARRVLDARTRLLRQHAGKTVAVVCHATPIKVMLRAALDAPARTLYTLDISPGSVSEVAYWTDNALRVRSINVTGTAVSTDE